MFFRGDPQDYYKLSRFQLEQKLEKDYINARKNGNYKAPMFINISQVGDLADKTLVEFIANVEDLRAFNTKTGKRMATMYCFDARRLEESRYGFSPTKSKVKCTIFSKLWAEFTPPLPDDVVHVIGRVNVDPEGKWPTSIIVDSCTVLPRDADIIKRSNDLEGLLAVQEEMEARHNALGDPSSSLYMIPAIEFKSVEDYESFKFDPELTRFESPTGRVQVSVRGTEQYTEIMGLKQTRGMVAFAARYGGVAAKIRLPKAQRAMERMAMMKN